MKYGTYDYVTKPFSMEELQMLLERVAAHLRLKTENRVLRETIKSRQGFGNIIGRAPEMEKLYRIITKAAQSTHPVLILGESGQARNLWRSPCTSPDHSARSRSFRLIVDRWC